MLIASEAVRGINVGLHIILLARHNLYAYNYMKSEVVFYIQVANNMRKAADFAQNILRPRFFKILLHSVERGKATMTDGTL